VQSKSTRLSDVAPVLITAVIISQIGA